MEEADAYHGNNDDWDEDVPQDDGDMEEQVGSLETAEALETTEMKNAF